MRNQHLLLQVRGSRGPVDQSHARRGARRDESRGADEGVALAAPSAPPKKRKFTLVQFVCQFQLSLGSRRVIVCVSQAGVEPYIAAEFSSVSSLGKDFIVGDEQNYNGYVNVPLLSGVSYRLFVRAIVKTGVSSCVT